MHEESDDNIAETHSSSTHMQSVHTICAAVIADAPKIRLEVVAIELRNPEMEATARICAMLDSGSEISMLRIPVAKKLGLTGVKRKVVLRGVNSTKTWWSQRYNVVQQVQQVDVVVSKVQSKGISCECEYNLANIYCVPKLPEIKSSLPHSLDIDKYPYLEDLEIHAIDVI